MNKKFIAVNRDQGFLLPPDMNDWLPKDQIARYIVSIVEQLDLSSICNKSHLQIQTNDYKQFQSSSFPFKNNHLHGEQKVIFKAKI